MKKRVKKILGEKLSNKLAEALFIIQSNRRKLVILISRPFSSTKHLSTVFYFVTGEFSQEAYASLKGRQKYVKDSGKNMSLYRRNIHRLEKAMIMRPRREQFAVDYILELVTLHQALENDIPEEQFQWGQHVLCEYFSVVKPGGHKNIDKAAEQFNSYIVSECQESLKTRRKIPFPYHERESFSVSYSELLSLSRARKSIRWFNNKPLDRSVLDKAVAVASQAPSACNRQPFHFYFTNDEQKSQKIASLAMGSAGFINNIQSMIVVVGDLSYYDCAHDRHVIYIDSSLATMQLLLAFETLGVGSCILNWPDIKAKDVALSNYLELEAHQRVICLIAVGYPDEAGLTPYSEKKSAQDLVKEI